MSDDGNDLRHHFAPGFDIDLTWVESRTAPAAYKAGYQAAFDRLLRTDDLTMVLSNFASMLHRKAEPTADGWHTEAKLFVSKMDASPHMTRWFPDWNAPRALRPRPPVVWTEGVPFLNTTVFNFLTQEDEDAEEAKRAKEAED